MLTRKRRIDRKSTYAQKLNNRNFNHIKQTLNQLNDEYDILQISGMKNINKSELAQNRKSNKLFDFRELVCPP